MEPLPQSTSALGNRLIARSFIDMLQKNGVLCSNAANLSSSARNTRSPRTISFDSAEVFAAREGIHRDAGRDQSRERQETVRCQPRG